MTDPDDLSEIDTTPEQFEQMWAEGTPVEIERTENGNG